MTDQIKTEILHEVRAALGEFGEKIADQMRAADERVQALDAKIAELPAEGSAGAFRDEWIGRLQSDRPMIASADLSVDEVIERGRARAGLETVEINGARVPLLRSLPRELERLGVEDLAGLRAVRMIRSMAVGASKDGKPDMEAAIQVAQSWGDRHTAGRLEETRDLNRDLRSSDPEQRERAARKLGTALLGSGGGMIGPADVAPLLDFLHPMAKVRSMGCTVLPMPSGILRQPYLDTGSTASYVGEGAGVNESSPGDAILELTRKIIQGVIVISKELARESSYAVDAFLRRHLAARIAAREDLAFMRGDGTQHTPRGITYWAGQATTNGEAHVFNRTLDTGAVTIGTITADALKAMRLPEDANVPQDNCGWLFKPRTVYGLMSKRNASTEAEIWPELRGGTFYGQRYAKTTQLPQNLAGDAAGNGTGNKTQALYACFGSMIIAESMSLEVESYDGGAYKDSTGAIASGITNREIVITAAAGHDFGAGYRGAECVVIDSMDWGA